MEQTRSIKLTLFVIDRDGFSGLSAALNAAEIGVQALDRSGEAIPGKNAVAMNF